MNRKSFQPIQCWGSWSVGSIRLCDVRGADCGRHAPAAGLKDVRVVPVVMTMGCLSCEYVSSVASHHEREQHAESVESRVQV